MKIKVSKITDVFAQRNRAEQPLLVKVLDTIADFKRKMELKSVFREIKQIYDDYREEEQKLVKKLITEYCDEVNKLSKKNGSSQKPLIPDEINRIPDHKIPEYNKGVKALLEAEIEISNYKIFYEDEIERAKIVFSEMDLLDEFVNWGKNKPSQKPKKDKPNDK